MPDYTFPPKTVSVEQLNEEVNTSIGVYAIILSSPTGVVFRFNVALSQAQITALTQTLQSHVPDENYDSKRRVWSAFPTSARLIATDIPNRRLTVRKTIGGLDFDKQVGISAVIQLAATAGIIALGDILLIDIVDGDPTKLIATNKVVL